MDLKRIVEETDTRAGCWFDNTVFALIIVSLVTFSIETVPELSPATVALLGRIELVTVLVFTIEYLLRLAVADRRRRFVFSFFGLIDLIAILPFYLSVVVDLRSVRVFRLLRLFRIMKLARYSRAVRRLHRAAVIVREELILFLGVALSLIFLSAVGIYYFENASQPDKFASVFHSLWWAIVTLTTVGYGDVYPITVGGRIFTFFVLFLGLGIVRSRPVSWRRRSRRRGRRKTRAPERPTLPLRTRLVVRDRVASLCQPARLTLPGWLPGRDPPRPVGRSGRRAGERRSRPHCP